MKKRWLVILLVFLLILDLMPQSVFLLGGTINAKAGDVYFYWPVDTRHDVNNSYSSSHHGTDIACPIGSNVYAVADGTVVEVVDIGCTGSHYASRSRCTKSGCIGGQQTHGLANFVRIQHSNGWVSVYGHLKTGNIKVKKGAHVVAGQIIALSGNAGYTFGSQGAHLHIELNTEFTSKYYQGNRVNPEKYLHKEKAPISTTLTKPTVAVSISGSDLTFQWNGSSGATYYWIDIFDKVTNNKVIGQWIDKNTTQYTISKMIPGNYYAYVYASNENETMTSDVINISNYEDVGTNFYAYIENTKAKTCFTNDNQNVSGRRYTGSDNQIWKFERNADGSYYLISLSDGCALEVLNWKDENAANVKVWTKTEGVGEKWYIVKNKLGNYSFKPQCALGRSADLNEVSSVEGTNIHLWEADDWDSQNFEIKKVNVYDVKYDLNGGQGSVINQHKIQGAALSLSSQKPTRSGYTFQGWSTSNTAMTATYQLGTSYTEDCSVTLYAVWRSEPVNLGDGFYAYIQNVKSGTVFTNDNQNVSGRKYTGQNNQVWKFERNKDGSYFIISLADQCALEVLNWKDENDANVKVWTKTSGAGENWYIEKNRLSGYNLKPLCALGRSADLNEASSAEGTNIHLWESNDWDSQNFQIIKVGVYNLDYNMNGGHGSISSQYKIQDQTLKLSTSIPIRTGYTFLGWSTSSTATSAIYQPGGTYTANSNITLYAVWKKNSSDISGKVISYDIGKSDTVTIRLLNSAGTSEVRKVQCKAGTSAQMAYEMKDVQAGSYILEVSKEGHVTRTCEVTVGENSVTQDVKICLLGDVTGDGKVNTRDLNRLYAHVNGTNPLAGYEFDCGDVTGDGKINTRDLNRLYAHISETNLLW